MNAISGELLPADGVPLVGGVRLPRGKRVSAFYAAPEPVAWITDEPVPDAGRLWQALEDVAAATGLRPLLHVVHESPAGHQPTDLFVRPYAVGDLDDLDAQSLLEQGWKSGLMVGEESIDRAALGLEDWEIEEDEREEAARRHPPFGDQFPGLAQETEGALTAEQSLSALGSLGPAYLSLVAASRSADILPIVGWSATDLYETPLPIAAVLRSWEDRFGARLVRIGPGADLRVLVGRPPRTLEAATAIAAEHVAFCGAYIDPQSKKALTTVSEIAPRLVDAPMWGFWWD